MASLKVQKSRILIYNLLKLLLFFLKISLNLGFSRCHQALWKAQNDYLNRSYQDETKKHPYYWAAGHIFGS
jgi:hypothetical protein